MRRRHSRSRTPPRDRERDRDRYRSRSRSYERRRRHSRSPPRRSYRSPPRQRRAPREVIRGTDEERNTTCCIFIGNLPYSFEERDVVNLFERFGRLRSVSVPIDRYTRRNRGFAFIEFEQRVDAEDAFNKYNQHEIDGRKLRLDWDIGRPTKDAARGIDRRDGTSTQQHGPDSSFSGRRTPPRSPARSPVRSRSRSPRGRSPMRDRSPRRDY